MHSKCYGVHNSILWSILGFTTFSRQGCFTFSFFENKIGGKLKPLINFAPIHVPSIVTAVKIENYAGLLNKYNKKYKSNCSDRKSKVDILQWTENNFLSTLGNSSCFCDHECVFDLFFT